MTDFPDWSAPIEPGTFTLTGHGVTLVSVGGTRVQLRAAVRIKVLMIKARKANTGTVYLGTVTVTNDENASTGGLQLAPGDMVTFAELDASDVYINGAAGDGVSYAYWV